MPPSLRKYGQGAAIALAQRRVETALAGGDPGPVRGPVIVSGLVNGTKGVARAARLTIAGLRNAGYAPVVHDLDPVLSASDASADFPASHPGGVWVLHANAPEAIAAMSRINPALWLGRYRIAYWAYELPKVPASWVRASRVFHEIWVPSRFVADALIETGITTAVNVMPHPVVLGPPPPIPPSSTNDEFVVLAMGDLQSSAARKNLIGAIEIYSRAFPEASPSTRLVLKVQSDHAYPEFRDAARAAAVRRADITFLTGSVPDAEIAQLIATSSVLLSPHRSEGFGLTLAEAFLAGIPALATGWSGNLDFMASLPELLVDYTLTPVRDPGGVYPSSGQKWAEPHIDDAAAKLLALAASPALRRELALRGRVAIEAQMQVWSPRAFKATPFGRIAEASPE